MYTSYYSYLSVKGEPERARVFPRTFRRIKISLLKYAIFKIMLLLRHSHIDLKDSARRKPTEDLRQFCKRHSTEELKKYLEE
jgi:hypothetical protein